MLKIVGDINFCDGYFDTGLGVVSRIRKGVNRFQYISSTDGEYRIGNMECVCSDKSANTGLAAKQFIVPPADLTHIKHLDLYGIANNHVMQHGYEAYLNMKEYLNNQGVSFVGSSDKHSHEFNHQGKHIGLTAFSMRPDNFTETPSYWHLPELDTISQELHELAHCDYRIVYVHWGNEFINYPYIDQKLLAHFLIDNGANLVVGLHPHILQGFEEYHGGTIFYSIGNFVFNMPWEPTKYSIIVNIDFKKENPVINFDYLHIGNDFCPQITTDVPQSYKMEYLNKLLYVCEENEKYYRHVFQYNRQYQRANRRTTLQNFFTMAPVDSFGIIKDFIKRKLK